MFSINKNENVISINIVFIISIVFWFVNPSSNDNKTNHDM